VTVAGRGETEPVADNGSAAGRRQNRRVTISYQARGADAPATTTPADALPPVARGEVTGSGTAGVKVSIGTGTLPHGTMLFAPKSVVRRGAYLQVDLSARNVGGDEATFWDVLGGGLWRDRKDPSSYLPTAASGVRLLDGDKMIYPLDYETGRYLHSCLCDKVLVEKVQPGAERVLSYWYPAPAAGQTTVTIDLPGRFRITGVPISR
jgi:hypothetical protein